LLHLAEFPFYVAALVVLGWQFGLTGCAAAFSLRCAIDCLALCHRAGVADGFVLGRLAGAGALVAAALAAGALEPGWPLSLALSGGLALLALALLFWLLPASIRMRLAALPGLRRLASQASSSTSQ
jgi:hypothetical protein